MAWPFGRKDRKEVEDDLTDERLRMMANVAIEQVPLPEEGIMTEEDAWTISPGPARVAMGGDSGPAPQYAAPAPVAPVVSNFDTSSLERLIANRLDMVEDVLLGGTFLRVFRTARQEVRRPSTRHPARNRQRLLSSVFCFLLWPWVCRSLSSSPSVWPLP